MRFLQIAALTANIVSATILTQEAKSGPAPAIPSPRIQWERTLEDARLHEQSSTVFSIDEAALRSIDQKSVMLATIQQREFRAWYEENPELSLDTIFQHVVRNRPPAKRTIIKIVRSHSPFCTSESQLRFYYIESGE